MNIQKPLTPEQEIAHWEKERDEVAPVAEVTPEVRKSWVDLCNARIALVKEKEAHHGR